MHIAGATDENYVPGLMVAIASAQFHDPAARFSVLSDGLSERSKERFRSLARYLDCRIDLVDVRSDQIADVLIPNEHLSPTACARLMLPQLLPRDSRVLYIDCDLLFLSSLAPVWSIDLGDALFAAVPDADTFEAVSEGLGAVLRQEFMLTGTSLGSYVNSGFMLIDLDRWRGENFGATCLDYLLNRKSKGLFLDQTAINMFGRGRIVYLNRRWNVMLSFIEKLGRSFLFNLTPAVLHYTGAKKPWKGRTFMDDLWLAHALRIAPLLPEGTLARTESFKNRRRRIMGLMIGKQKHWIPVRAAKALRHGLPRGYLDSLRQDTQRLAGRWIQ